MSSPLHSLAPYSSQVLGLSPSCKLPASQAPRFACLPGWCAEHTCEFKGKGSRALPELSPFPPPAWLSRFWPGLLTPCCWGLLGPYVPRSQTLNSFLAHAFAPDCPRPSANSSVATNFKLVTSYRMDSSRAQPLPQTTRVQTLFHSAVQLELFHASVSWDSNE